MNDPIKYASVTNPTMEDLHFKWDSAPYVLKAGETETKWQPHMAKHAAKKLADKNVKTTNPEEHRTLMGAYLEDSDPQVIAKRLGINFTKIRKEAMTKEKAKARVNNLEAQMLEMKEAINEMKEEKKELKKIGKKEVKVEVKEKVKEEPKEEELNPVKEEDKVKKEVKKEKKVAKETKKK